MSLAELHNQDGSELAQILESLRLETYGRERVYFGLGDCQGKRLIIQFPVYFSEIPALIPVVNRPVDAIHVKEIKHYILRRAQSNKAWILGSLVVNVNSNDISYQSLGSKLYVVRIENGTLLRIADGQHRISAIAELMSNAEHRRLIGNEQIPLTLVIDKDAKQADLDFRDMAQATSLSPVLLAGFSWEGRDGIAHALISKVSLFRYTELAKAIPGTGTKNIYTACYITQLVSCAIAGDANADLLEYDTQESIEKAATDLSDKLSRFFSCCPSTASLVAKEQLTVAMVAQFKSNSILALSVGLEVLGHLIHRSHVTPEQLATQIDWSRTSDWWKDLMVPKNGDLGKHRVKAAGAASAAQLADRAIARLKDTEGVGAS
jgi:DNA sulfur modification protein DndB